MQTTSWGQVSHVTSQKEAGEMCLNHRLHFIHTWGPLSLQPVAIINEGLLLPHGTLCSTPRAQPGSHQEPCVTRASAAGSPGLDGKCLEAEGHPAQLRPGWCCWVQERVWLPAFPHVALGGARLRCDVTSSHLQRQQMIHILEACDLGPTSVQSQLVEGGQNTAKSSSPLIKPHIAFGRGVMLPQG